MSSVAWIPRIGADFAGYRLLSLIGHGGMSIVYRAEHIALGRAVALKLLSPQLSEDETFRERFQRESRMAASLEHPNVIPVYEGGEQDGVFFIAMRYVDGADLKTRLKRDGPLDPDKAVSIVSQVATALEAAHAKGLIHRDVKPANILIAPGAGAEGADHAYLSDFGVAKSSTSAGLTRTGLFVGTADYASPEQIEGKQLDGRADVYSLGCVAYEALTAAPAYDKDSEVAMMYAHLLEAPPKVTEKRSGLSAAVDDAIATAMAKSRDDRYATPSEFARALKRAVTPDVAAEPPTPARETVLASGPPGAAPAPAAAAAAESAPAASAPAESAPQEAAPAPTSRQPWSRRTKLLLAAAIGAVVVLAGVLVPLLALRGGGSSSAPDRNLLAVLVPTQIAAECTTRPAPDPRAVETDVCVAGPAAPTSEPNRYQLSFYPSAAALFSAYDKVLAQARGGTAGSRPLAECGSTPAGVREWVHATGKVGGRRFCYTDTAGSYVLVWTHEKRGSPDHVDMLGIAREPGRAPTIYRSWWTGVRDFLGKCRPAVSEEVCASTIKRITGRL